MFQLLIIEDDIDLLEGLKFAFSVDGFHVTGVTTESQGLSEIETGKYDIIILDCNLPDGDGFHICSEVRKSKDIPMIMLTARDTEIDEVKALELGVNDYMSKPFSLAVLKARVKRIMQNRKESNRLTSKNIMVDLETGDVFKDNEKILFSKQEYKLLLYFMENANHVLSKEQILSHIWDVDENYVDNTTVSVYISRIRSKLGEGTDNQKYIKTIHGIGYIWKE